MGSRAGSRPWYVAVAVPQDDGDGKRSQAGPAPSIIGGRPWSTMLVSTCHWKAPAYALWTQSTEGSWTSSPRSDTGRLDPKTPWIRTCLDAVVIGFAKPTAI